MGHSSPSVGRSLLHPRYRDTRCRRVREVCRVSDARCCRRTRSRFSSASEAVQ